MTRINYDYDTTTDYLTETRLEDFLKDFLPETTIIHNKTVPDSGIRNRPDFRIDELKLIIEFDGYLHYTKSKTILVDKNKDDVYSKMGYIVKRIPYFVQLNKEVINWLFKETLVLNDSKLKDFTNYKHGFIDKKVVLPADFCSLGIKKFNENIILFDTIINNFKSQIEVSLKDKVKTSNSELEVYPIDSLF